MQWYGTIFPRIRAHVPANSILEIASGFGPSFTSDQGVAIATGCCEIYAEKSEEFLRRIIPNGAAMFEAHYPTNESGDPFYTHPLLWVWWALAIASLVHVWRESSRDKRIGNRWWHVGMNMLVLWPLPYLCWLFWWPGSLRQAMFVSDRDKAHQWARNLIEEKKRSKSPDLAP